jgi:2-alkyl-3-oxoalkanoate reductase
VRRDIQQASGFVLKEDAGLADESARLATDASAGVAASAPMYADVEARLLNSGKMQGTALRDGFFYGPNTWYCPEGAAADHGRRREMAVVGQGEGVWSFVHIEEPALASVTALTAPPDPDIDNVVDDDPSPVSRWLPAVARWVGAPPPPQLTEQEAREVAGKDVVYYGTTLSGASNDKANKTFNFKPRRLQWLNP